MLDSFLLGLLGTYRLASFHYQHVVHVNHPPVGRIIHSDEMSSAYFRRVAAISHEMCSHKYNPPVLAHLIPEERVEQ